MKIRNPLKLTIAILSALTVAPSSFADLFVESGHPVAVSLIPYAATFNYADTQKTTGTQAVDKNLQGIYAYIGRGDHSLELEADLFTDTNDVALETNGLAIYSYHGLPGKHFRLGYHGGDTEKTTDFETGIIGISKDFYNALGYKRFGTAFDYYLTHSLRTNGSEFYVQQFSPNININFSSPQVYQGYFTLSLTENMLYFDVPIKNAPVNGKSVLAETDMRLAYFRNRWSWSASLCKGDTVYPVRDQGFVILNEESVNKSTAGLGVKYQMASSFAVKFDYEKHDIESLSTQNKKSSESSYNKLLFGFLWNL